jgi:hypothetical protein
MVFSITKWVGLSRKFIGATAFLSGEIVWRGDTSGDSVIGKTAFFALHFARENTKYIEQTVVPPATGLFDNSTVRFILC